MRPFITIATLLAVLGECTPAITNCSPFELNRLKPAIPQARQLVKLAFEVQTGITGHFEHIPVVNSTRMVSPLWYGSTGNLNAKDGHMLQPGYLASLFPHGDQEVFLQILAQRWSDQAGGLTAEDLETLRTRYFGHTTPDQNECITSIFRNIHNNRDKATFNCVDTFDVKYLYTCMRAAAFVDFRRNTTMTLCPQFFFLCPFSRIFGSTTLNETTWTSPATASVREMMHLESAGWPRYITDMPLYWPTPIHANHFFQTRAYGAYGAQQLAYWSTEAAMANADNYALYAGAISMGAYFGLAPVQPIETNAVCDRAPWDDTLERIEAHVKLRTAETSNSVFSAVLEPDGLLAKIVERVKT